MRLFVALELPAATREALRAVGAGGGGDDPALRLRRADALHVTLAFLGRAAGRRGRRAIGGASCARARPPAPAAVARRAPLWLAPRRPRVLAVDLDDPARRRSRRCTAPCADGAGGRSATSPSGGRSARTSTVARVRRGARVAAARRRAPPPDRVRRRGADASALAPRPRRRRATRRSRAPRSTSEPQASRRPAFMPACAAPHCSSSRSLAVPARRRQAARPRSSRCRVAGAADRLRALERARPRRHPRRRRARWRGRRAALRRASRARLRARRLRLPRRSIADLDGLRRPARARADARGARSAASARRCRAGATTYRVLADYVAELDGARGANPGLVRPRDAAPESVEGRDIRGVEIAERRQPRRRRPARSTSSWACTTRASGRRPRSAWSSRIDLAQQYGVRRADHGAARQACASSSSRSSTPTASGLARHRARRACPARRRCKRKNCRAAGRTSRARLHVQRGVDLNRNYGAYWGGNGASSSPATTPTAGRRRGRSPRAGRPRVLPAPADHELPVDPQHRRARAAPAGFRALGLAPDEDAARRRSATRWARSTGYSSEYGYQLYEVTGATEDWNYVAQGAFGYTIELGGEPAADATFQGPYQTHVVDQYLGSTAPPDRGARRARGAAARRRAGGQPARPRDRVAAPRRPGAVLRLHKVLQDDDEPDLPRRDVTTAPGRLRDRRPRRAPRSTTSSTRR